jgi:hypothetical protein
MKKILDSYNGQSALSQSIANLAVNSFVRTRKSSMNDTLLVKQIKYFKRDTPVKLNVKDFTVKEINIDDVELCNNLNDLKDIEIDKDE